MVAACRVEPVLDVWFDSGAMPAAQFHYPFEGQDLFERRFPADFICEAIDQTRGWFYSLLAVNTLVFQKSPYRNVVCLALLLNQDGQRMSKSRGIVIDPWTILETQGADALRWNFLSSSSPWTPKRVSIEGIDESTKRFLVTLWETQKFFVTYADLDGWEPGLRPPLASLHVLDRWIRSRLDATVHAVTESLEAFDALRGAQALEGFVDDLSNWYVRRSRPRFWNAGGERDDAAHATLHECLHTVALMLAPYCPFVSDALYENLTEADESVHLAEWPVYDGSARDVDLEDEMKRARVVVSLGLGGAQRGEDPGAPAVAPGAGAGAGRRAVLRGGRARDRRRAEREGARARHQPRRPARLLGRAQLPRARAEGREAHAAREGRARGRRRRHRAPRARRARHLRARARRRLARSPSDPTTSRCGSGHTRSSCSPRTPGTRSRSTPPSTTTCAPRASPATSIRAINDRRRELDFDIADRIRVRITATGRVEAAAHRHRDWIAREVLAVEFDVRSGPVDEPTVEIDGEPVGLEISRV